MSTNWHPLVSPVCSKMADIFYYNIVTTNLPTIERLLNISLLDVKDKCFYMTTKWAFTGISGLQ